MESRVFMYISIYIYIYGTLEGICLMISHVFFGFGAIKWTFQWL